MQFKTNEKYKARMSLTSLYFQSFIYYDRILTNILLPFQMFLFIYKYNALVYQPSTIVAETILLVLAFFINLWRLSLGSSGNHSKSILKMVGYYFFTVIIMMGFIYLIVWQIYVLWLQFILYIIALVIIGGGLITGIIALVVYQITS